MKKILISAAALLMSFCAGAQILTPVKWAYASKKVSATEAVVLIKATIDNGWHIYSQHVADGGPVKTALNFTKADNYALIGSTIEPKPVRKFEKAFDMNVSYFEKSVVFQQKIKLNTSPAVVKGTITFMVCSNKECLPPEDVEFSVAVK